MRVFLGGILGPEKSLFEYRKKYGEKIKSLCAVHKNLWKCKDIIKMDGVTFIIVIMEIGFFLVIIMTMMSFYLRLQVSLPSSRLDIQK